METLLARLKPFDPARGYVLRRYTFAGIRFDAERAWYRVSVEVAEYLRQVRQVPGADTTPLAFDVMTEEDARAEDAREADQAKGRRSATDALPLEVARPAAPVIVTTDDLPKAPGTHPKDEDRDLKRTKKERD